MNTFVLDSNSEFDIDFGFTSACMKEIVDNKVFVGIQHLEIPIWGTKTQEGVTVEKELEDLFFAAAEQAGASLQSWTVPSNCTQRIFGAFAQHCTSLQMLHVNAEVTNDFFPAGLSFPELRVINVKGKGQLDEDTTIVTRCPKLEEFHPDHGMPSFFPAFFSCSNSNHCRWHDRCCVQLNNRTDCRALS